MASTVQAANILVVDDVATNLELARRILVAQGYRVSTAMDGEAALEAIASQSYEVVLLDIHMPGMDGFEVCRRIRQQEQFARAAIILLSASDQSDDILKQGEAAGATTCLAKPFTVDELTDTVTKVLECR